MLADGQSICQDCLPRLCLKTLPRTTINTGPPPDIFIILQTNTYMCTSKTCTQISSAASGTHSTALCLFPTAVIRHCLWLWIHHVCFNNDCRYYCNFML